jgi:hypothetical protein
MLDAYHHIYQTHATVTKMLADVERMSGVALHLVDMVEWYRGL